MFEEIRFFSDRTDQNPISRWKKDLLLFLMIRGKSAAALSILMIINRACRRIRIILLQADLCRIQGNASVRKNKSRDTDIPDLLTVVKFRPMVTHVDKLMHIFHMTSDIDVLKLIFSSDNLRLYIIAIGAGLQSIYLNHILTTSKSSICSTKFVS